MLTEIHHQVIQEKQLSNMLKIEIARQKEALDSSIRQTISAFRNFGLLDIWYPKLSEAVVQNFLHSPIFTREQGTVYESPSALPFNTSVTSKINNFLKHYLENMPEIVQCINEYFSRQAETINYLPSPTAIQFFSSSTFLSLFGYCWCVEQGAAYVDSLIQLLVLQIKQSETVNSVSFRTSFIREIIRQFMHTTGVQTYLRLSLSNIYIDFINEEDLSKYRMSSKEYLQVCARYASLFTDKLLENIPFMPSLLRYFFRRAFVAAQEIFGEDSQQPTQLIEIFFFDLLLQPALINPKLFALIPETSVLPHTTHTTIVSRMFLWATGSSTIQESYEKTGFTKSDEFTGIRVHELIKGIRSYNGEVDGIFSARLQNVSDMRFHLLILSVNDVLFIAHIINTTCNDIDLPDKTKEKLYQLTSFEKDFTLPSSDMIDFWFQAFKLPPQPFVPADLKDKPVLYIPLLNSDQHSINTDHITPVINHLIVYLESLPIIHGAPSELLDFCEFHRKRALENGYADIITKTQAVSVKILSTGADDVEILNRVKQTIENRTSSHALQFASSFLLQEACAKMDTIKKRIRLMNDQLTPIIHQSLLRLFLIRHKNLQQEIQRNEKLLCTSDEEWLKFFQPAAENFMAFSEQNGLDKSHRSPIMRQLHSTLVSMIPYQNFINANPNLVEQDREVYQTYDRRLEEFLLENYSPVLKQLFKTPSTFDAPIAVIRRGTSFGGPLERLQQIMNAIDLIQDIYTFEAGEGCPGDDFLPLFIYVLIRARLPNFASSLHYLNFFLFNIDGRLKLLDSMENYCATTFRTSAEDFIINAQRYKN